MNELEIAVKADQEERMVKYKAIVDCNSFYCSCEKVFRPDLRNKPVVVLSNNDGCIISQTDEAKSAEFAILSFIKDISQSVHLFFDYRIRHEVRC